MNCAPLAAVLAAATLPAAAQALQPPKPPVAVYWMSVETAARTAFDAPPGQTDRAPPGPQSGKRMRLDLGTSLSPRGEPRATHAIPPALGLGAELPLVTPKSGAAVTTPEAAPREPARDLQRTGGRMLVYWGCGETVRAGQPVVIDFSSHDGKGGVRGLRSVDVGRLQGPAPGRQRSYGAWPNQESQPAIPADASLRGLHFISGNYTPDIQFSIDASHDFMDAVEFMPARRSEGGGTIVNWKAVPTATGYFATVTGRGERDGDVVLWSSSEVQETGHALLDYLPGPEVERLIKDKVVLAPQTNSCTVPAGLFEGGNAMMSFIAYGRELDMLFPLRPKDVKEKWEPVWALRVRRKSTASTMLGAR